MDIIKFFKEQTIKGWNNVMVRLLIFVIFSIFLFLILRWLGANEHWYAFPIAIFSASLIGFFFEAYEFKKFLQETTLDMLQDKRYLGILKKEKLDSMLKKIHQVYYGLPEELEKGNLYEFVKENILRYLGKAYEKDVVIEYDLYKKEDYVEIKLNKQFAITASSEKPVKGDRDIFLRVTPIAGKNEEFHFPFDEYFLKVNGAEIGFPADSKKVIKDGDALKFSYKLEYEVSKTSSETIDYKIVGREWSNEKLIHQTFLLPANGFRLRVTAHDFGDCIFSYKFSGSIEPKPEMVKKDARKFDLNYDGWMIPGNSITVYFSPKNP